MKRELRMLHIIILVGTLVCAVGAISSKRLVSSALWLAGASALVALLIYLMGAPEVAVIELSVGAGLVTVLFVFAINIAGEEGLEKKSLIPRPLAWLLIGSSFVLLGLMVFPGLVGITPAEPAGSVVKNLWQDRELDVLLQMVLIFTGVLGVVGLLGDRPERKP
jgi:uncharacterized MnhB-related membrane protein